MVLRPEEAGGGAGAIDAAPCVWRSCDELERVFSKLNLGLRGAVVSEEEGVSEDEVAVLAEPQG